MEHKGGERSSQKQRMTGLEARKHGVGKGKEAEGNFKIRKGKVKEKVG
jgi:hypothetical protein